MIKIAFLGSGGSGKSSFVRVAAGEPYTDVHVQTIGVDFKTIVVPMGSKKINVQMWEFAGGERFKQIIYTYYPRMDAFVILFDVGDRGTFQYVETELNEIIKRKVESAKVFIIGNKIDKDREVPTEQAQQFCLEHDAIYFQCSCKQDEDPNKIVKLIAQKCSSQQVLSQIIPEESKFKKLFHTLTNLIPLIVFLISLFVAVY